MLDGYGLSEQAQRLLALQLAGGCMRTENGREVRGEIDVLLFVDPTVNQSGLFELLSELAPNSTTIDGTDASYGGLFANTSNGSLQRGVLLEDQYDWYFIHRGDNLKERALRALSGLLESGTHSVTKAGVHDQLENHASHLLISAPKYGQFDLYDPIHEQLPPLGGLASKVNLLAASVSPDSDSVSHDAEPFTIEEAAQYLEEVRAIEPTVSDEVAAEIDDHTQWLNDRIGEELPHLQRHPHSVRRLVEARARLHRSESVGEVHLMPVVAELIDDAMEDLGDTADEADEDPYDVDVVKNGRSKTQRDRVKGLKRIVRELQEEHDDKPGAPEEKVRERAQQSGMSPSKIDEEIFKLKDKGELYGMDADHLRLV